MLDSIGSLLSTVLVISATVREVTQLLKNIIGYDTWGVKYVEYLPVIDRIIVFVSAWIVAFFSGIGMSRYIGIAPIHPALDALPIAALCSISANVLHDLIKLIETIKKSKQSQIF